MKNSQHNLLICLVKGITTKKVGLLFKELLLLSGVQGRPSSYYAAAEFCDTVDCSVIDFHVFPSCIQCVNYHLIICSCCSYQVASDSFDYFANCSPYVLGTVMFKFHSEFPKVASFFI
jgi:hypothetical protein